MIEVQSLADFVDTLEARGIQLSEVDGELTFRAPVGVMTAQRRKEISARKPELLEYLRGAQSIRALPDPAARHEPFPLTDIQMAYVLGRRSAFAYGGVGCHAYGELEFDDLDGQRVAVAWRALVARHDMLRAVFEPGGSQQVLPKPPELAIAVTDLRGRGADEAARHIAQTRAQLDHRVYPIDRWPLFEVRVTRADGLAVLHLSIDFLIADFVSIQLLLDEFAVLYRDPEAQLPPLDITFRDYLVAERRLKSTRRHDKDREYWWNRLDELPGAPDLPVLGDRAPGPDGVRFTRSHLFLSEQHYAALKEHAAAAGVTPSVAILAAYAEVIDRWSRRRQFTLDVTLLRRQPLHAQVDRLVGDFTSALLLQVQARGSTFGQRAVDIQRQLWEDMDHLLVSGVQVLRELSRRRGQEAALMPVVFTSALGLGAAVDDRARRTRIGYGVSQTPQVWIDCQAFEHPDGVVVNWDCRQGVFPDGMVNDMFTAFERLVRDLAGGVGWQAADPVSLPAAQLVRRREIGRPRGPVPEALLHEGLVAQCAATPQRPALIAGDQVCTYGELLARANGVAAGLIERGCGPGDLVGVLMEPGPDQVIGVLGVLLTGAAYLPIDNRQPHARRVALLEDAQAKACLVSGATSHYSLPVPALALDGCEPLAQTPPAPRVAPGDRAYVIYTSGSTGKPKGVIISHRGAVNTIEDINRRFGVGAQDRVLALASLAFDLSVYDIFGPLAVGGALVLPQPQRRGDPSHWAELIARHSVTLWNSVPAQLQMLAEYLTVESDLDLPTLRLAMLSGDWIAVGLPDRIRSRLPGLTVHSLGGATEASIWSIGYPIGAVDPAWASIPYGMPLTNQRVLVLDDALRECPDWTVGELYIGGVGVADGYLGDEELTRRRFIIEPATGERLYRTGDLGRYLPDGNIEFLGREDLQVKIRGHRIELAEIEVAVQSHPGVGNAAVVVEGDSALDRKLVAFVEPARRTGPVDGELPYRLAAKARDDIATVAGARDTDGAIEFARQLDHTALVAMMHTLREAGLFETENSAHTVEEVFEAVAAAPKHRRLIRRWLKALHRAGMIVVAADGRMSAHPRDGLGIDADSLRAAWQRVDEMSGAGGQRIELIEYFRTAAAHLPGLVRDEIDPVRLLFPEGTSAIQESAYRGNLLSESLNRLLVAAVCEVAGEWADAQPLRLLEIGAGVGGASMDLIPALAQSQVDYLFTDVSQFFLNGARERFGTYPWVDYDLFDLNVDYRRQGMTANSFDVIVCANVLHYAKHAGRALENIRELLRPGGWLMFIETTRDNYQILTSMEFLFDAGSGDFEDVRADQDETFISVPQWRELLAQAGAEPLLQLSESDRMLDSIGMHVFAARFKADRVAVRIEDVRTHAAQRLPVYMLPARWEIIDAIPHTGNAKVDRKALTALLPGKAAATRGCGSAEPQGAVETAIAALWADVLNVERVFRDDDFFALGGDSLSAAQLVGRIRDEIPGAAGALFDQMLRDVLEGATVASLAAGLTTPATPDATQEASPAAPAGEPFRIVGGGADPVQLVVPDPVSGQAFAVAAARAGHAVAEVRLPGDLAFLAEEPEGLVEKLAAEVVAGLEHGYGDRPIELVGQDTGAFVAVEVARRLGEVGRPAAGLTVVHTHPPVHWHEAQVAVEFRFATALGADYAGLGTPPDPVAAAALDSGQQTTVDALAAEPADWRLGRIAAALDQATEDVAGRLRVFERCLAIGSLAAVAPYDGDVTLVLGFDPELWPRATARLEQLWRDACLGEVRTVHAREPVS